MAKGYYRNNERSTRLTGFVPFCASAAIFSDGLACSISVDVAVLRLRGVTSHVVYYPIVRHVGGNGDQGGKGARTGSTSESVMCQL